MARYKIINTTDSFESMQKHYQKHLKRLGSGLYAKVFQHPTNPKRVIKLAYCEYKPQDDPYLDYLSAIKAKGMKTNPWFPKIHSLEIYRHKDEEYSEHEYYYIVEMEKLVKYHTNKIKKKDKEEFFNSVGIIDYDDVRFYSNYRKNYRNSDTAPTNKYFCNLTSILSDLFDLYGDDLHANNIMWRVKERNSKKKIQLVVTDPVA